MRAERLSIATIVAMASDGNGAYPRRVHGSVAVRRRVVAFAVLAVLLLAALLVHSALAVDTRGATMRHITFKSRYVHQQPAA